MHRIVEQKYAEVALLCQKYGVRRLDVFGSAADGRFDEARSDLDFLVDFRELPPGERADAFFGLLAGLEDLFGREVDLVVTAAIENRYFRKAIERSRVTLYAA